MARPSFSIPFIASQTIQAAAGIRLKSVHDQFGPNVRLHNRMHVIGSHMRRPKVPHAVNANLAQSVEHGRPLVLKQAIGRLIHLLAFYSETRRTGVR